MKKIYKILMLALAIPVLSGCDDWLQVYPQNEQVSDYYWKSKEDVEAIVNSGYFYLRSSVESTLIPLGELRGSCIYSRSGNNLQSFRIKPTDKNICNWGIFYQIINVANAVIENADIAYRNDRTYDESVLKSHKTEAYFQRALCYFYLVRNWKNVPLILKPNETDANPFKVGQSDENIVIEQIKKDIRTALSSGAAKEQYEKGWESKGRATKWALCALMADVCLWSEDYTTALRYCNEILNSTSSYAPRFLSNPSHSSWFTMFNPGNSNESIFELQWNYEENQKNNLPILFDNLATGRMYEYTPTMLENFNSEYRYTVQNMTEAVRTMYGGYYVSNPLGFETATNAFVWKYMGSTVLTEKRTSEYYDPNFIIYRVADVILMKAEALVLMGENRTNWSEAIDLIDKVRVRSNLAPCGIDLESTTEEELLTAILHERKMELAGEGKCWYDILRFGRRANNKYKESFLVAHVLDYNNQASTTWIRSVLSSDNALFLPVWEDELKNNDLLIQNPYYK